MLVQTSLEGKPARLIPFHKGTEPLGLSNWVVAIILHYLLSGFDVLQSDGLEVPVALGLGVYDLAIGAERVVDVIGPIVEGHPRIVALEVHASVEDGPNCLRVSHCLQFLMGKGAVLGDAGRVGEIGIVGIADPINCSFGDVSSSKEALTGQWAVSDLNGVDVGHVLKSIKLWNVEFKGIQPTIAYSSLTKHLRNMGRKLSLLGFRIYQEGKGALLFYIC